MNSKLPVAIAPRNTALITTMRLLLAFFSWHSYCVFAWPYVWPETAVPTQLPFTVVSFALALLFATVMMVCALRPTLIRTAVVLTGYAFYVAYFALKAHYLQTTFFYAGFSFLVAGFATIFLHLFREELREERRKKNHEGTTV